MRAYLPPEVRTAEPEALVLVASRDHAGALVRELIESLPGATTSSIGSSIKFCLIAEGRADLYLRDGPTSGPAATSAPSRTRPSS